MVYKDNAYQPIFHFTEISKCHMCITSYCIGKSLLLQSHSKQGEVSETRRTARQRLYSMILKSHFFSVNSAYHLTASNQVYIFRHLKVRVPDIIDQNK